MPEICRFYGIIIRMFLIDREHPPPHIHIKYGEYQAVMELENLNVIDGQIPKKCRQLVREWAELYQDELKKTGGNATLSCASATGVKPMKLQQIEHRDAYRFALTFENGDHGEVDLQALIGQHVALADVQTARIDQDWGCLEFLHGQVDIEPKTLYRYAGFQETAPSIQPTAAPDWRQQWVSECEAASIDDISRQAMAFKESTA